MSKFEILNFYEQSLMHIQDIIGSKITNNQQLEKLGSHLFGKKIIGVFSSDHFPKLILNNQCFILNNKSSRSNGEHWIGFYKYNNKIYSYDTFSRPVNKLSRWWFKKNIINANHNRSQSYLEYDCGQRSLAWLVCFKKYKLKSVGII